MLHGFTSVRDVHLLQAGASKGVAMKWLRFCQAGEVYWGVLRDNVAQICSGSPFEDGHHVTAERLPLDGLNLLPPSEPSKIVCVGRNYAEHAKELGNQPPQEPLLFLKPPSAVLPPGDAIRLPSLSRQVEHEGELAVVIGRRCRDFRAGDDPRPFLFGFTCLNDVTARDLQKTDGQWTRAKGFDTFCPFGPVIEDFSSGWPGPGPAPAGWDSSRPWRGLKLETRVNDQLRQAGDTADWLFSLDRLLAAISAVMTLEPGDLIATGTPAGVGRLQAGDRVSVEIAGIGRLENPVV